MSRLPPQVINDGGRLTFTFTRPLAAFPGGAGLFPTAEISMAPGAATPMMWALFPSWTASNATGWRPAKTDRHFDHADKALDVDFSAGSAVAETRGWGLNDAQRAHGALMFLGWGLLYPFSALANRHLKPRGGPLFFKVCTWIAERWERVRSTLSVAAPARPFPRR